MNAPNVRLLEASWGKRLLAASLVGLLLGLGALLLVARLAEGLLHPQTLVAGWYLLLGLAALGAFLRKVFGERLELGEESAELVGPGGRRARLQRGEVAAYQWRGRGLLALVPRSGQEPLLLGDHLDLAAVRAWLPAGAGELAAPAGAGDPRLQRSGRWLSAAAIVLAWIGGGAGAPLPLALPLVALPPLAFAIHARRRAGFELVGDPFAHGGAPSLAVPLVLPGLALVRWAGPRLSSLLDAPGPWILALAAGALLTGLVRARDRAVARSPLLALALLPCLAGWALGAGLAARVLLR